MSASDNEIVSSGIPMPRIAAIRNLGNCLLAVTWAEGSRAGKTEVVDLGPAINSYKFYRPLRKNEALFGAARLDDDGYAILWGNGDIDVSAETVESLAEETMSPQDFSDFLRRNNLTQAAIAAILGMSRRKLLPQSGSRASHCCFGVHWL
jgi:hypothetical protein